MRVMVIVKADENTEAGVLPSEELLAAMTKQNEELVKAGIMLAGEGLHASSKGKRVRFSGDEQTVIDGPFAETNELIAGFWLWQVKSMEEAVEQVKRCPNPTGVESEIEIRSVLEADDFGDALTPELREAEASLRSQIAEQQQRQRHAFHIITRSKEWTMQLNPYLNFDGQCAEAFRFYERLLGGRIETMMTHGESPIAQEVPADWHDRIMHARLVLGDQVLMASDAQPGQYEKPQGMYVSLQVDNPADAERVFHALAEHGTVTMPIQQTFWAARFGMVVDRFGIPWMVNSEPAS